MEIVLLDQTRVFVFACCMGLALGAFYDIVFFLGELLGKKILRPFFDIFYCLVFMLGFIWLIQTRSDGQIRWYAPGGVVLGLCLYFLGFSGYIRAVFSLVEGFFKSAGRVVGRFMSKIARLFEPSRGS